MAAMKFRNKKLFEQLMERKCGPMEAKAGKQMKRARQERVARREQRYQMDDY